MSDGSTFFCGKLLLCKWLDNLPNPPVITNWKIDVSGNENETDITDLVKVLSNTVTVTSIC